MLDAECYFKLRLVLYHNPYPQNHLKCSTDAVTYRAPQPNSASWTSAPDDNIILSKLATEAIETPTSRTFDTENQTAHRLASLKPPELGDNNRDVSSPQSSTNAENNPLNSPTHLSARAQRAWMKGKDLPLVPERSRSPYETGLFTGVRGANGIEGAQGGNDGDEEEY